MALPEIAPAVSPTPTPDAPATPAAEPLPPPESSLTEYLVYYRLSGLLFMRAPDMGEASEQTFASLHTLVGKAGNEGISAEEAAKVRLDDTVVEIEAVEVVPHEASSIREHTSPRDKQPQPEAFDIASVSRANLEGLGFDISQITDEQMEKLARRMADDYLDNLFWTSLKIMAEYVGIPKRSK
jgi:hypothetical protein